MAKVETMFGDFDELIATGERLRETEGKFDDAIKFFEAALKRGVENDNELQMAKAYGQLGLTYRHMGQYDTATLMYTKQYEASDDLGAQAKSIRHQADLKYLKGEHDSAIELAKEACKLAHRAGRVDMVWFTHGVTKSMIAQLDHWMTLERIDLNSALRSDEPNDIQKRVWRNGYYLDQAAIWRISPFGWAKGLWSLLLSVLHSLKLHSNR